MQETENPKRLWISIHALREEGDPPTPALRLLRSLFLSTPSARRATFPKLATLRIAIFISIHALREEGDAYMGIAGSTPTDFYPRPPRGGRPWQEQMSNTAYQRFLSTPSARRATLLWEHWKEFMGISIHALREEGDLGNTAALSVTTIFLSTPSARRATKELWETKRKRQISIHALREEGDAIIVSVGLILSNFYPRPPRGGRQQKQRQNLYFLINYTTFCTNLEEP